MTKIIIILEETRKMYIKKRMPLAKTSFPSRFYENLLQSELAFYGESIVRGWKSGKSTKAPPRAIDISDKPEIALQAAAS